MPRHISLASVATALTLLGACQPAAAPPAAPPPAPTAPLAAGAPADAETLSLKGDQGVITMRLGGGAIITARDIGPVGPALVQAEGTGPKVALKEVLKIPTEATPVTGYQVTAEAGSDALCGAKPTVAVAIAFAKPVTLAAITGALPGEPGAVVCNVRVVAISPN